jgi:GTP-binding protein LepA
VDIKKKRNFCIIAHIDHGKSTLADRFLEITNTVPPSKMREQFLDTLEIERERGITIKAQTVRMKYTYQNEEYELNLIDTPGHVDFSYEVSRSISACEGAILVVDAVQGVEAQTLANATLAFEQGLEIIPAINKIDLPGADPERVKRQIEEVIGIDTTETYLISAKKGWGVKELLEGVIRKVPPPKGDPKAPLRAMVFDSWYDNYLGVIVIVRVFDGELRVNQKIKFMSSGKEFEVQKLGYFSPFEVYEETLSAGDVGFIIAGIKTIKDVRVGDTITDAKNPAKEPLPGFKVLKSMVYAGFYPVNSDDYHLLRDAMEKFSLNDAGFVFEPESSSALGFGFRCGFLGLLHMDVVRERLEREFGQSLIITAPNVLYRVKTKKGEVKEITSPSQMPDPSFIESIEEPYVRVTIHSPDEFVGSIFSLCEGRRGIQKDFRYAGRGRVIIEYELPFAEILVDFYDKLKSITRGYGSMDYEFIGFRKSDIVKLDILINKRPVDALSTLVHRENAYNVGRELVRKLKEVIPRQLFEVAIQAAIGSRVIARETIKPLRKDVTAKCYGGDVTRKMKLLEKQKEGKKRMKMIGKVEVPQEAFLTVLKIK